MADLVMLEPEALLRVLSCIDARQWGARAQVVSAVGCWPRGVLLSGQDLADVVGLKRRRCRELTDQLVATRVLLADPGRGRRPSAWRVNPNVREWLDVPWRIDPETAAYRALHGLFHGEHTPPATDPHAVLLADPYTPATKTRGRALSTPPDPDLLADMATPATGNPGVLLADMATPPKNSLLAYPGYASYGDSGRSSSSPTASGDGTPTTAGPAAGGSDPIDRLRAAVMRHAAGAHTAAGARSPFVGGRMLARLQRLEADYGAAAVLATLSRAPTDLLVPGLVDWLGLHLAHPDLEPDAGPGPEPAAADPGDQLARLRSELAGWRNQADQYAAADADVPETVTAAITRCENGITQLHREGVNP